LIVIVIIVEICLLNRPGKAVTLETREPHDLFLVAATRSACTRRQNSNRSPPIRHRAVRIEKLIGNLEIRQAPDKACRAPAAFDPNEENRSGKPGLKPSLLREGAAN
jgi:hypothetical protein